MVTFDLDTMESDIPLCEYKDGHYYQPIWYILSECAEVETYLKNDNNLYDFYNKCCERAKDIYNRNKYIINCEWGNLRKLDYHNYEGELRTLLQIVNDFPLMIE